MVLHRALAFACWGLERRSGTSIAQLLEGVEVLVVEFEEGA
jgi:hypothetical protein